VCVCVYVKRWLERKKDQNKEIYERSTTGRGTKRFNIECACFDVYANFISVSVMLFESRKNGPCTWPLCFALLKIFSGFCA